MGNSVFNEDYDWRGLRRQLEEVLNIEELRTICYDLRIDYDGISGENKFDKARELLLQLDRIGRMSELIDILEQDRPNYSWNFVKTQAEVSPVDQVVPPPSVVSPHPSDRVITTPMIPFDWITIPAGQFQMGSDKGQDRYAIDNETDHKVFLPEYHISQIPVTVKQFRHFVTATRYETTAEKQGWAADWTGKAWEGMVGTYWERPHGPHSEVQENHPVTCISWYDAIQFCKWAKVRLPSEAEWEKAAGWDTITKFKYIYPWGNEPPDKSHCNFDMQIGDTTPVDSYPIGINGLIDMAGNVWEWTSSLYRKYPYDTDERENPASIGERVVRGGSFFQPARSVRCAFRHWHKPDATVSDFGFRVCALEPS